MNYPIKATDLLDTPVEDDEQATMLVIEAVVSNSQDAIGFVDGIDRNAVLESLKQWPRFEEYKNVISSEKSLFKASIGNSSADFSAFDSNDLKTANEISTRVVVSTSKKQTSKKHYAIVSLASVAAGLFVVSIGLSLFVSQQSSGRKSSANKIANVESSSPTNTKSYMYSSQPLDKSDSGSDSQTGTPTPENSINSTSKDDSYSGSGGINASAVAPEKSNSNQSKVIFVGIGILILTAVSSVVIFVFRKIRR